MTTDRDQNPAPTPRKDGQFLCFRLMVKAITCAPQVDEKTKVISYVGKVQLPELIFIDGQRLEQFQFLRFTSPEPLAVNQEQLCLVSFTVGANATSYNGQVSVKDKKITSITIHEVL